MTKPRAPNPYTHGVLDDLLVVVHVGGEPHEAQTEEEEHAAQEVREADGSVLLAW